jgi:hypothetical protein
MSDKEVCRKVLEKILGVSIREVSVPATQKTINMLYDGKGIRLDVYLNDDEGTVYNVEMERGKHRKATLPKRSRYYHYPNHYKIQTFLESIEFLILSK